MSGQQVLIIGMGQFGMALGRALSEHGDDVIAVDINEDRTQIAGAFAAEAITLDATEEGDLALLRPGDRDLCVCSIGDDSREASILVTAMLRQFGAKRIVARSTDDLHQRILLLVGAHEVINPERLLGERLAARYASARIVDILPLGDDMSITELRAPTSMVGRTLAELRLPKRFKVVVAAVRREVNGEGSVIMPEGSTTLEAGDILVTIGRGNAAVALAEER
ncbi:MAG: trk system potassium uptake protein TrkA [Myxococcota bacterium]|jgi:trk system potassium uptake protein TrkA